MKNKILISLLCLFVAGCGFQLRGSHNKDAVLPNQLKKVFLDTQQLYSGLAYEIRYLFKSYGTEFVENKELASLQLRILKAHHEKRILSIGSNAKAKENEIIYEIQFDAIDENGKQVMPPQKIRLTKDYLDNINNAAANMAFTLSTGTLKLAGQAMWLAGNVTKGIGSALESAGENRENKFGNEKT